MKKFLLYTGMGLLVLVVVGLARPIGKLVGRATVEKYQQGNLQGVIEKAQEMGAREARKQLPLQIDEVTTLQTVLSAGTRAIYHNRLSLRKGDIDLLRFGQEMEVTLRTNVCGVSDMRYIMERGGSYSYIYIDVDGMLIDEFIITLADCSETDVSTEP